MFMKDQQGPILVSPYVISSFFNYFCPFSASKKCLTYTKNYQFALESVEVLFVM